MDKITIRLPVGLAPALEAEYRRTYASHGLSRNAWYVSALLALLAPASQES